MLVARASLSGDDVDDAPRMPTAERPPTDLHLLDEIDARLARLPLHGTKRVPSMRKVFSLVPEPNTERLLVARCR